MTPRSAKTGVLEKNRAPAKPTDHAMRAGAVRRMTSAPVESGQHSASATKEIKASHSLMAKSTQGKAENTRRIKRTRTNARGCPRKNILTLRRMTTGASWRHAFERKTSATPHKLHHLRLRLPPTIRPPPSGQLLAYPTPCPILSPNPPKLHSGRTTRLTLWGPFRPWMRRCMALATSPIPSPAAMSRRERVTCLRSIAPHRRLRRRNLARCSFAPSWKIR